MSVASGKMPEGILPKNLIGKNLTNAKRAGHCQLCRDTYEAEETIQPVRWGPDPSDWGMTHPTCFESFKCGAVTGGEWRKTGKPKVEPEYVDPNQITIDEVLRNGPIEVIDSTMRKSPRRYRVFVNGVVEYAAGNRGWADGVADYLRRKQG